MVKELKINPKFRDAAIPLSKEKFEELKADIKRRGCLVPIVTWKGTIVDGHNRYAICKELGIDFETVEQEFDDEVDARYWIFSAIKNSRHPTTFQRCEMAIPFKDDLESKAIQNRLSNLRNVECQNFGTRESKGRTNAILGQLAEVSHETMRMARRLLEEGDEATLERLRTDNKLSISGAYKHVFGKTKPTKKVCSVSGETQVITDKSDDKAEPNTSKVEKVTVTNADDSVDSSVSPAVSRQELYSATPEKKDLELYPEVTQIDHLMEVPAMRDEPQREPHAFMFVEDQVRFACRNYIEELRTGIRWLKDDDRNRLPELLQIIRETNALVEQMYKEMED